MTHSSLKTLLQRLPKFSHARRDGFRRMRAIIESSHRLVDRELLGRINRRIVELLSEAERANGLITSHQASVKDHDLGFVRVDILSHPKPPADAAPS